MENTKKRKKIILEATFALALLISTASFILPSPGNSAATSVSEKNTLKVIMKKVTSQRRVAIINSRKNKTSLKFLSSEKLTYKITYLDWITAGTAVLSAKPGYYNKNKVIIYRAKAKSSGWLDFLYYVNDDTRSFFSLKHLYPLFLSTYRNEGGKKAFIMEKLNIKRLGSVYSLAMTKNGTDSAWHKSMSFIDTQDSLSDLYYIRMLNLKKGGRYYVPVFNNNKRYLALVKGMGYYMFKTPAGKFNCIKLKIYSNFNGVFSHKGIIVVYVTQRHGHIPVYMKTNISLGFVSAVLVKIKG